MLIAKLERWFTVISVALIRFFHYLAPLVDFVVRVYIAKIFFVAGLSKLASWYSTLTLFTYTYHVPLISPVAAAYLGTAAELVFPVLLVIGFGSRIMIFAFFVYNIIAAVSYPFLWTVTGSAALMDHVVWGLFLALLMTHGPGKWSLDHLLYRWHLKRALRKYKGDLNELFKHESSDDPIVRLAQTRLCRDGTYSYALDEKKREKCLK